jgi:hypothetical protein
LHLAMARDRGDSGVFLKLARRSADLSFSGVDVAAGRLPPIAKVRERSGRACGTGQSDLRNLRSPKQVALYLSVSSRTHYKLRHLVSVIGAKTASLIWGAAWRLDVAYQREPVLLCVFHLRKSR